jgi:hypothetical protein
MAKGVARFASAIFACAVMLAPSAGKAQNAVDFPPDTAPAPEQAVSDKPEKTGDDCLTTPSGEAPQGQRWFYRIERGTQRHCWYLRDKTEQRAPQPATAAPAKPLAAALHAALPPRPNADARAELPAVRSRLDSDNAFASKTQPGASPVTSDSAPQPLDTYSTPPPAADPSAPDTNDPAADIIASPGMPVAPTATPDASSRADAAPPKTSLQKLLIAIFGALAFAGVTGSLIPRFAFIWRKRRARLRRRTLWQSAKVARNRRAPVPKAENAAPRAEAQSAPITFDEAQGQIEEILSGIAKRVRGEPAAPALAKSQAAVAASGQRS